MITAQEYNKLVKENLTLNRTKKVKEELEAISDAITKTAKEGSTQLAYTCYYIPPIKDIEIIHQELIDAGFCVFFEHPATFHISSAFHMISE